MRPRISAARTEPGAQGRLRSLLERVGVPARPQRLGARRGVPPRTETRARRRPATTAPRGCGTARGGAEIGRITHEGWVRTVAFSAVRQPDGDGRRRSHGPDLGRTFQAPKIGPRPPRRRRVGRRVQPRRQPGIATVSGDTTARVWDGASGSPSSSPSATRAACWASPSGPTASGWSPAGADQSARLWNALDRRSRSVASGTLRRRARRRVQPRRQVLRDRQRRQHSEGLGRGHRPRTRLPHAQRLGLGG